MERGEGREGSQGAEEGLDGKERKAMSGLESMSGGGESWCSGLWGTAAHLFSEVPCLGTSRRNVVDQQRSTPCPPGAPDLLAWWASGSRTTLLFRSGLLLALPQVPEVSLPSPSTTAREDGFSSPPSLGRSIALHTELAPLCTRLPNSGLSCLVSALEAGTVHGVCLPLLVP